MMNSEYKNALAQYTSKDGVKTTIIYLFYILCIFFQGFIFTLYLNGVLLDWSQVILAAVVLVVCFGDVIFSKKGLGSIGLRKSNWSKSVALGISGAILLLLFYTLIFKIQGDFISFSIGGASLFAWLIFIVSALEEEVLFRGYIQTRLSGSISNQCIVSCVTALLFILAHYPVRWMVSGFSLTVLPGVHVLLLILLHFLCSFIYQKTNNIWGAVILHFLYNVGGAMIMSQ